MLNSNNRLNQWLAHPVSKTLIRILTQRRDWIIEELNSIPEDAPRDRLVRKLEQLKVLSELLDFNQLLLDEIEEE